MVPAMNRQEYEQLDIHQMERMVARALLALVDDSREHQRITLKRLATRTQLPLHRVREVTDAWNLQALSGDELWLIPGTVERARALCEDHAEG
jgi:hypothetical protein